MRQAPRRRPRLDQLRSVSQLCAEYPNLFTEGGLRWLIFQANTNGFDACVIRVGKRVYIDLDALQEWLAEHRGTDLQGAA
jgi:hypothetical protein